MDDRFKFRVWRAIPKKMEDVLKFGKDYKIDASFIWTTTGKYHSYNYGNDIEFVLMQCTGLKDKNGKLIYEGDVVETIKYDRPFSSKQKCKAVKEIVYWNSEYMTFSTKDIIKKNKYTTSFGGIIYSEIIGNVYENPEFLEIN